MLKSYCDQLDWLIGRRMTNCKSGYSMPMGGNGDVFPLGSTRRGQFRVRSQALDHKKSRCTSFSSRSRQIWRTRVDRQASVQQDIVCKISFWVLRMPHLLTKSRK